MIVAGRHEMTPDAEAEDQLCLSCRLAAVTADAYVEAGFPVVVQDIIIGRALAEFVELVKSHPLLVVVLAPSAEEVAIGEAARSKTGHAQWSVEQFDRELREKTPRIGLWIDSSRQKPEQTVGEILDRARNEAAVRWV